MIKDESGMPMSDSLNQIARMLISLLPVILAGVSVMVVVKLPVLDSLKKPMDGGKRLADGKRLFGDHKTWKGFIAYPLLAAIWTLINGWIAAAFPAYEALNYLYVNYENRFIYNLIMGLALGLAYAAFELPNSFMKRRLGIDEGETTSGLNRYFFIFIDQADSVIGCVLVLAIVYPMSLAFFLAYILLGAAIHILFNALLQVLGLRKQRR